MTHPTDRFRLLTAQINPTVGDIAGNARRIRRVQQAARHHNVDLILFPELTLSGYPPEDLVRRPDFLRRCAEEAETLAALTSDGPDMLVGLPWDDAGVCRNAVALLAKGKIADLRFKHYLPNEGVFDEVRTFVPGPLPKPITWRGLKLGVPICEDWWQPDVCAHLAKKGAELLLSLNGSPYRLPVAETRRRLVRARTQDTGLPFVFCNQVGGQDELVFDGHSTITTAAGTQVQSARSFGPHLALSDWSKSDKGWRIKSQVKTPSPETEAGLYQAMCTSLRDYINKSRFPGVILGLSGGIDSALSLLVAVDALGAHRVQAVMMPSPYTSQDSLDDAEALARNLGVQLHTLPIAEITEAFEDSLLPVLPKGPQGLTAENLQSRTRGVLLMALSNSLGLMTLTTGNKSEMAVGYATLYGDMCGGYNVLKDLYKTQVYHIARWRNAQSTPPPMPERILTRAPSAELRPDQTDQDSLPPYEVLDAILMGLVDREDSLEAIIAEGHSPDTVREVQRLLRNSEYKRRQAPPGVKLSERAFGRDWRYPLVNHFQGGLSS